MAESGRCDPAVRRSALDHGQVPHRPLEGLRRNLRVVLAQIGQQDVLAGADAPSDRLADRPDADDDDALLTAAAS